MSDIVERLKNFGQLYPEEQGELPGTVLEGRLRAAQEWRPIESAPRDGTAIIGWQNGFIYKAVWLDEYDDEKRQLGWLDCENDSLEEPTHWLPFTPSPGGEGMSITEKDIPAEVYAAALRCALDNPGEIRPLIAAGLNAWPDADFVSENGGRSYVEVILPLHQQEKKP